MISVVVGTYNRASMLAQALEAALAQTGPTDEIVVSDDASTDTTWEVLQGLANRYPRIRSFRLEQNSGGAANWNFAVSQARGDYIALCSDDDRFLPGHLENSVEYLRAHPGIGLVHSSFVDAIEKKQGSRVVVPRPLRSNGTLTVDGHNLLRYMIRYYDWPFHPSTIVMRRVVWDRTGPFDAAYSLTDTDWFVRAAELFPVAMLPRHGVINRRHMGNWSNRVGSAQMQREIFGIVERLIGRQRERGPERFLWQAVWRANVRLRLLLTLRARLRTGHVEAAIATWEMLCKGTGKSVPVGAWRMGEAAIRGYLLRRDLEPSDSVSPL